MPGTTIASFILRFIREPLPDVPSGAWRGIVRHIQTGEQYGFTRLEDAMAFIAQRVEAVGEGNEPKELKKEEHQCA
ncbi:MAG: hypothetical protein RMK65_04815 [Anaerolineae bacterium]|nr:hypothetical protein [Anaerolineae bacterium]MCX8068525.1 hypothetical protein [Anaerolineae bacterium]MDW7991459.1 hypothetical protein [Anaerolineae bacterium]